MERKVFILLLGLLSIQLPSLAFKIKKKVNVNSLYPNAIGFYKVRERVPTFYNFGCKAGFDYIGFKQTGVNASQLSTPGLNLGIYLNIKSSQHFSYRHELVLAYGIFQKNSQKDIYCSRIDIPSQVNYHFSARNMISVGIMPTIILSSNTTVPNQESTNKSNKLSPIQLGSFVGVELAVAEKMGFGLRFVNYLKNVNNPEKNSGFNGMVQMYLNYSISNTFRYDKKLMSFRYERY